MINDNKYKRGDVVYDRTRPSQKLIVSRYADRVYYCKDEAMPASREFVYLERDLLPDYKHLKT